jgi:hypothetical protein
MPSELNNGATENLSLLQYDSGLVDLFQRITVSHQLLERELAVTHPLQEERKIGIGVCGTETPTVMALVQQNCVQVDRDIGDGKPEEDRMPPWLSALGPPGLTASRIWRAVVGTPTASKA